MLDYPIPSNENMRTRAVDALDLMRLQGDPFLDAVTAQVRAIFDVPVAFVSLFSGDTQTFLAQENVPFACTPRAQALCAHTVAARRTIAIPDTHLDPRSKDHPIVIHPPHVRYSISAPVILSGGFCIGTVCAIDLAPRDAPSEAQVAMLENLATMIARFYEIPLEPDPAHAETLRALGREAQSEFLDLVGHELRTPLNGIVGLAEAIEPADEAQGELLGALLSSAERLDQIVGNVISFTELGSGEMTLDEAELDLRELAGRLVTEHRVLAKAGSKRIALRPGGPVRVRADAAKIELALANMLANALAHGGDETVVTVVRGAHGAFAEVADDGPGIAPRDELRIWEAFAVGGGAKSRRADGIGLGLPLTRRIADLHGGDLTLSSGADGLRAAIHLPLWRCDIEEETE